MNREQAESLLGQLLADELDESTKAELHAYLETDPGLREQLADMRLTAQLLRDAVDAEGEPTLSPKRMSKLIALDERSRHRETKAPRFDRSIIFSMRTWASVAAVLLLMVGLGGMMLPTLGRAKWAAEKTMVAMVDSVAAMEEEAGEAWEDEESADASRYEGNDLDNTDGKAGYLADAPTLGNLFDREKSELAQKPRSSLESNFGSDGTVVMGGSGTYESGVNSKTSRRGSVASGDGDIDFRGGTFSDHDVRGITGKKDSITQSISGIMTEVPSDQGGGVAGGDYAYKGDFKKNAEADKSGALTDDFTEFYARAEKQKARWANDRTAETATLTPAIPAETGPGQGLAPDGVPVVTNGGAFAEGPKYNPTVAAVDDNGVTYTLDQITVSGEAVPGGNVTHNANAVNTELGRLEAGADEVLSKGGQATEGLGDLTMGDGWLSTANKEGKDIALEGQTSGRDLDRDGRENRYREGERKRLDTVVLGGVERWMERTPTALPTPAPQPEPDPADTPAPVLKAQLDAAASIDDVLNEEITLNRPGTDAPVTDPSSRSMRGDTTRPLGIEMPAEPQRESTRRSGDEMKELAAKRGNQELAKQVTTMDKLVEASAPNNGSIDTPTLTGLRPDVVPDKAPDISELPTASTFKVMPVNPWVLSEKDHQSTFALDTDSASYTLSRNYIQAGYLPPAGAVRMEEFVNAFDYQYRASDGQTFTIHAEAAPAPFTAAGRNTVLLKVGVKGKVIGRDGRKPMHLVFVVDASGSMARADRLPLVRYALGQLSMQLQDGDRVSLVTYGTDANLHLEATPAGDPTKVITAINNIQPGGSTNLLKGIEKAYQIAGRHFRSGQVNRIILCSDGVANIGETDADQMLARVAQYRKQGITFTAAGFGMGGLNDALLEELANKGDGNYLFVDTKREAYRAFVTDMTATLQTIAKDAKIQVEFNPVRVRRYRLVGYENRDIADKDFRNDTIDAGEVGSGQSATALYELELTGPMRSDERLPQLGTVYVRYRDVDTHAVEEISRLLSSNLVQRRTPKSHPRFYLAASAGAFAELLRQSPHTRDVNFQQVLRVLEEVAVALPLDRQVSELRDLVRASVDLPTAP